MNKSVSLKLEQIVTFTGININLVVRVLDVKISRNLK